LVGVVRVADAHGDGPGMNVAVINVPTIWAVFGATAGKFGHAGIEARAGEPGKQPANSKSLLARAVGAYSRDGNAGRQSFNLSDGYGTATMAALTLAYIAHYDFGLSRQEIRTPAVAAAAVIAMLVAVEFFGKKLRKPK
jgi:hypothetical protein